MVVPLLAKLTCFRLSANLIWRWINLPSAFLLKELLNTDVGVLASLESFDLVAIDDLEAIRGNREWQEAIFHLINRSREGQGQLIFAAKHLRQSCIRITRFIDTIDSISSV